MPTWRDIHETTNLRALENVRSVASYAIQSQYSASPKMLNLMAGFQKQLDLRQDADTFYHDIFDIYTATGYGLDNWGRIVAISRNIEDPNTGATLTLDDDYYRLLLLYKCLANISASDANSLNHLLKELINTGIANFPPAAYVLEPVDSPNWPMVIRWVFEDYLDDIQRAVFFVAGTLARGAGVGWELYALNPRQVFGFTPGWQPFNQAPFAPDQSLIGPDTVLISSPIDPDIPTPEPEPDPKPEGTQFRGLISGTYLIALIDFYSSRCTMNITVADDGISVTISPTIHANVAGRLSFAVDNIQSYGVVEDFPASTSTPSVKYADRFSFDIVTTVTSYNFVQQSIDLGFFASVFMDTRESPVWLTNTIDRQVTNVSFSLPYYYYCVRTINIANNPNYTITDSGLESRITYYVEIPYNP